MANGKRQRHKTYACILYMAIPLVVKYWSVVAVFNSHNSFHLLSLYLLQSLFRWCESGFVFFCFFLFMYMFIHIIFCSVVSLCIFFAVSQLLLLLLFYFSQTECSALCLHCTLNIEHSHTFLIVCQFLP